MKEKKIGFEKLGERTRSILMERSRVIYRRERERGESQKMERKKNRTEVGQQHS